MGNGTDMIDGERGRAIIEWETFIMANEVGI